MHYPAEEYWGYNAAAAVMTHQYRRGLDMLDGIVRLASGRAVVIFSVSGCCICHAVKQLFCGMGVNPTVYELDQDPMGKEIERTLVRLMGGGVFVCGKLVGAMDRDMATHIKGTLVPLLKEAGVLWLCMGFERENKSKIKTSI